MRLLRNLLHRAAKPPKGDDDAPSAKPPKGRRDRTRAVAVSENLARFRDDPAAFVAHALPNAGAPYPKQTEMMRLAANERRVSVVGCNASGKDWTLARLILWWVETRPRAKVVVIAPTQRQIERILWPELASAIAQASIELSGKLTQSRYEISPERFAIAFSTNKPENILGFHSPELMLIVDEAHAVEESHFDAARRLNAKKTILVGNAFSTSGEFYDSHHGKADHYKTLRIPASDTPNLMDGAEPIPGLIDADDIADRKRDWGADHPKFAASVNAVFPDSPGRLASRPRRRGRRNGGVRPLRRRRPNGGKEDEREPVYIGVDVARFGEDKSVLIARQGQRVIETKSLGREMDTMRVAGEAAMMARDLNAEAIFVDENGVGGGVCDRLKETGAPVYGVQFGRRAPHPARFANLRSEIFWELRRLMNDRLIALPDDETLAAQLLSLRYDVSSSGQVKLESKRETRKRGIPSPDRADALALAFMRPPSLQIWTGNEPFLRPRDPAGVPLPPPARDDDSGPPGDAPDPPGDSENYPLPLGEGQGEGGATGADGIDRHSRVGGNPVGAQAPRQGATRPVPEDPTAHPPDRESGNPEPPAAPSPILVGW